MGVVHAKDLGTPLLPKREINYDTCETSAGTKDLQLGVKARVDVVNIDGLGRTKDDIVKDAVSELFTANTFHEVIVKAHKVRTKLDSLGCFRNIAVYIDTNKSPKATPDGLEITFHVKELKRIVGGISTQIGHNEGSLVLGLRAPNVLGRGERVQLEYSYGSHGSNNINVAFIKPFRGKHNPLLTTSVYDSTAEWPSSGYKERVQGGTLDFGLNSFGPLRHNLQWDVGIRSLSVLTKGESFDVREESGPTLKSALRHILNIDLRNETIFPSCGTLFQLNSEVAGLGGDVGFVKNSALVQTNYSIIESFVLQGSLTGGVLNSIGNDWKIGLSDMFYLGGPLTMRGFQMRGIGPHSEGNALGSTWFWSAGLHLFTPLPFRPGKGGFGELFRSHFFVNVGNIGNFEDERAFAERISQNIRIAYGLGVALRLGHMARIEINYCFPHVYDNADVVQPGIQFGIGVQFL